MVKMVETLNRKRPHPGPLPQGEGEAFAGLPTTDWTVIHSSAGEWCSLSWGRGPGCTAIELSAGERKWAAASPSPPLEERVGERRPFTRFRANSMALGPE